MKTEREQLEVRVLYTEMILDKRLDVWVSINSQLEFGKSFLERMNWGVWTLTGWSGHSPVCQSQKIFTHSLYTI